MTRYISLFPFFNSVRHAHARGTATRSNNSFQPQRFSTSCRSLSCLHRLLVDTPVTATRSPARLFQHPLFLYTPVRNAGHSKWQNIMHTKLSNDAKKQAIRSKICLQIKTAITEGGGSTDPKLNKKLADMIGIARNNQVPVENIQRILTDNKGKVSKLVSFGLKGPEQTVIIVETETENTNKMRQELSALVKKKQFTVVDVASVMYTFQHVGIILCSEYNNVPVGEAELDTALVHAIEAGADDVTLRTSDVEYGTVLEFTTDPAPNTFYPVISALQTLGYKLVFSQLDYVATNQVELSDAQMEAVGVVCEKIIKHPGVVRIFDNIA